MAQRRSPRCQPGGGTCLHSERTLILHMFCMASVSYLLFLFLKILEKLPLGADQITGTQLGRQLQKLRKGVSKSGKPLLGILQAT
jgi:hypothetical protein